MGTPEGPGEQGSGGRQRGVGEVVEAFTREGAGAAWYGRGARNRGAGYSIREMATEGGRGMADEPGTAGTEPRIALPGFAEEALPWLDAVFRFGLRLTGGDQAAAEDLTQETFLRAYRHWSTYTPGTSCRSWLFTICRNAFLRGRERESRRGEVLESEMDHAVEALASARVLSELQSDDPEQTFFKSFLDAEVEAAVANLPPEFHDALVMSDIEGLSYNEIAQVLDIPVGTVKSRLYRGRRLLAQALREYATEMGYIRGGVQ